jgi:hypothetical protein
MTRLLVLLTAAMLAIPSGETIAQRTVEGTTLISDEPPSIRLQFDSTFQYLGSQELDLYDVAHVEQHFFADTEEKRIRRLYWVQFEQYQPAHDYTHDYSNLPEVVTIGGHPFRTDARLWNFETMDADPESDFGRALGFLGERGYTFGPDFARQRMVWVYDDSKRSDIIIIYAEDLTLHDVNAKDLSEEESDWTGVAEELKARALAGFALTDL